MRILYDGQMFCMQKTGGINRYFSELISRLPDDITPIVLLSDRRSVFFPKNARMSVDSYPFAKCRPKRFWNLVEPYYLSIRQQLTNAELFHPTFYKGLSRKDYLKSRCPMIVTVWDILHLKFKSQLDPDGSWGEQIRRTIESADALLCISENTKTDILQHYRIDEARTHVIPLATSLKKNNAAKNPGISLSEPYFLFVGGRAGYKNFSLALAALKMLLETQNGVSMFVAGEQFSRDEEQEISAFGLADKIRLFVHPDDYLLSSLYSNSVALLYPSSYEGFGLPALEALSCETTVIAFDSSSLPETIGDSGILLKNEDAAEWAKAMEILLTDEARRSELVKLGIVKAQSFEWSKVARATAAIYRSLIN